MNFKAIKTLAVIGGGLLLAGCNGALDSAVPKHKKPVPEKLKKMMKTKGMSLASPMLLRIYKQENVLEVWKRDRNNKFALLNTYEICKWSGKPGPKLKEGDRQAPEGFYHVTPGLMNPNSSYHLSFNMGFPNKFDRANDRTGSYLMIHGACSSAGCYSMTDEYVEEIYAMAREAFSGGQKAFQIQAFPFRMTAENMAKHVDHKNFQFWSMLKEGADYFEVTKKAPKVEVCEKRYVFNRTASADERFNSRDECPATVMPRSLATAFKIKQDKDQAKFNKILKQLKASPFVKAEDKPITLAASISARPTVGPLALIDPVVKKIPSETAIQSDGQSAPAAVEGAASATVSTNAAQPLEGNPSQAIQPAPATNDALQSSVPTAATAEPAISATQAPQGAATIVPQPRPQSAGLGS